MVIVVAEGAGQDLIAKSMNFVDTQDASGNKLLLDVGLWLSQKIKVRFVVQVFISLSMWGQTMLSASLTHQAFYHKRTTPQSPFSVVLNKESSSGNLVWCRIECCLVSLCPFLEQEHSVPDQWSHSNTEFISFLCHAGSFQEEAPLPHNSQIHRPDLHDPCCQIKRIRQRLLHPAGSQRPPWRHGRVHWLHCRSG